MRPKPHWEIIIFVFFASIIFMPLQYTSPDIFQKFGFPIFEPEMIPSYQALFLEWVLFGGIIYWVFLLGKLRSNTSYNLTLSMTVIFLIGSLLYVPRLTFIDTQSFTQPNTYIFEGYDFIWHDHLDQTIVLSLVVGEMLAIVGIAIVATKLLTKKIRVPEELITFDSLSLN